MNFFLKKQFIVIKVIWKYVKFSIGPSKSNKNAQLIRVDTFLWEG